MPSSSLCACAWVQVLPPPCMYQHSHTHTHTSLCYILCGCHGDPCTINHYSLPWVNTVCHFLCDISCLIIGSFPFPPGSVVLFFVTHFMYSSVLKQSAHGWHFGFQQSVTFKGNCEIMHSAFCRITVLGSPSTNSQKRLIALSSITLLSLKQKSWWI